MIYVLKDIMEQEVVELWHKDTDLQGVDAIILPGGFSYGDYLRSGAIARFSPIMDNVIRFAQDGGFVFGVCNGFQILCEAGLLPGTLMHNSNLQPNFWMMMRQCISRSNNPRTGMLELIT
jgi:phosphoribosylformylglycinamidine synthase